jgi:1,4-alpha-glucan branching enzyme
VLTRRCVARPIIRGFFALPADAAFPVGGGHWGAFVSGLDTSAPYRFWIVGSGSTGLKRDPHARELSTQPAYPDCDCLVNDPRSYPWHDAGFRPPDFRDLVLYQLHVGVFYAVDGQGRDKRQRIAKFIDLLDRVDYLRAIGVNDIQLMPIREFPSETQPRGTTASTCTHQTWTIRSRTWRS